MCVCVCCVGGGRRSCPKETNVALRESDKVRTFLWCTRVSCELLLLGIIVAGLDWKRLGHFSGCLVQPLAYTHRIMQCFSAEFLGLNDFGKLGFSLVYLCLASLACKINYQSVLKSGLTDGLNG